MMIVGNKIDLRGDKALVDSPIFQSLVESIMEEFKEIITGLECSAKAAINVSALFYFAQKAVLYPVGPLYDCKEHVLKLKCAEALRRLFKLSDKDKDGLLNDNELNAFQKKCFGFPLQTHEIEGLKAIVSRDFPQGLQMTTGNPSSAFFNEDGFLFLQLLCIQRNKQEAVWSSLRKFGYGDDLSLKKEFLCPFMEIPQGSSCELSPKGYQFFTELFRAFDKDKDGALLPRELAEFFCTTPGNPWLDTDFPNTTITNSSGGVTLQGFLAQWSMSTLLDYKTTLKYLAYLGFDGDSTSAIQLTKSKRTEHNKKGRVSRSVFFCYVFGNLGSGKTSLLRSFVGNSNGKSVSMATTSTGLGISETFNVVGATTGSLPTKPFAVVNSVEVRGAEKYLVMVECGTQQEQEFLNNPKKLESCDVACFLYDSSDPTSFAYVAKLRVR